MKVLCERGIKDLGSILRWVWMSVPAQPGCQSHEHQGIRAQVSRVENKRIKYCEQWRCYLPRLETRPGDRRDRCILSRQAPSQHITRRHDLGLGTENR